MMEVVILQRTGVCRRLASPSTGTTLSWPWGTFQLLARTSLDVALSLSLGPFVSCTMCRSYVQSLIPVQLMEGGKASQELGHT